MVDRLILVVALLGGLTAAVMIAPYVLDSGALVAAPLFVALCVAMLFALLAFCTLAVLDEMSKGRKQAGKDAERLLAALRTPDGAPLPRAGGPPPPPMRPSAAPGSDDVVVADDIGRTVFLDYKERNGRVVTRTVELRRALGASKAGPVTLIEGFCQEDAGLRGYRPANVIGMRDPTTGTRALDLERLLLGREPAHPRSWNAVKAGDAPRDGQQ